MTSSHKSRFVGVALLAIIAPVCIVGACTKDESINADTPMPGATSTADSGGRDVSEVDSGQNRKGCDLKLQGPAMAEIPTETGSYCMDTTEVTQGQYAAFLATKPDKDETYWPPVCKQVREIAFEPLKSQDSSGQGCGKESYDPTVTPAAPVRCVDWCDAQAYCAWAGKRLCGKIGGGYISAPEEVNDPKISMWFRACSQGGTTTFAVGAEDNKALCATSPEQVQQGSSPTCHGSVPPYDQIRDLEGYVVEFEAANPLTEGPLSGSVVVHFSSGSKAFGHADEGCAFSGAMGIDSKGPDKGFRCCVDLAV